MNIGIDKIDFYTPNKYLDLVDLAHAREVDPNKFLIGIGQKKMAIADLDQDIVAMGANAAEKILTEEDKKQIGLVIVATESGVDQSKAASLFVQDLLNLPTNLRAFEIKEACYGATAGLQMARDFIASHPEQKALVIAADVARYGLNSGGEVTQGAGAVAMLVSKDPHILALEQQSIYESKSTDDFWRPNYSSEAFAKGKYSEEVYLQMFSDVWDRANDQKLTQVADLQSLLFHIPFSKMGRKGLRTLEEKLDSADYERLLARFEQSILYGQEIGNIYTGSLYLSLISLLDNDNTLQSGDRIGLFSYGSGSVAELFFGILQPDFQKYLQPSKHQVALENRKQMSMAEYEATFEKKLVTDGSTQVLSASDETAPHYLAKVADHERYYK